MNQGALSDFIEAQRNAGTVESAGSFTLAIEKARDKLASYSLSRPEDYILKLVQCAVILGVDELFIELQRSAVILFFEVDGHNHDLAVDRLTDALLSPLDESHRGRSHLSLALCAMAAEKPVELMWGEWGPEDSLILSLGHGRSELFRNPPFPRTEPLPSNRRFHLLYMKKPSTSVSPSQTAVERDAVVKRCSFAPIRINIGGKRLGPSLPPVVSRTDPLRELGQYLGAFRLEQEPPCTLHWPKPVGGHRPLPHGLQKICNGLPPALIVDLPEERFLPLDEPIEFSAMYGVEACLYGPSQIHYLKDGVLMDPVTTHKVGGNAFAVLDGNDLRTDLTGLKVVEAERVTHDISQAVAIWKTLIDKFLASDPPLYYDHLGSVQNMDGPMPQLRGALKFLYKTVVQGRRPATELKTFRRQLQTRRSYLEYFREES
jgi:hypothetical protein